MSRKRSKSSASLHAEYESDYSDSDSDENILIPNADNSGSDDSDSDCDSISDSDSEHEFTIPNITYKKACATYSENLDKLEKNHEFIWIDGEKSYPNTCEETILLSEATKKNIQACEPFQLFETFFSAEMKQYIIDASKENNYDLKLQDLDTFIGIVIFSSFNKRKSQRDYWSSDPFLSSEIVSSAMTRDKFEEIKSKIKYSKAEDKDPNDRGWRVRSMLKLFQNNLLKFGIWKTSISIDEMMAKSYAKTVLKQFIRGKPIRFGLKFWGLCTSDGYLLNLDLYCGKSSQTGNKLVKCALGTRVVLHLLEPFFRLINYNKIPAFHLYFDNFFTNMDLILHLQKLRLKCTGTIRDNRVKEKNILEKKAPRGTYIVKHDRNSGINFITIMDSKPVSIASTAAGVSPLSTSRRYSSEARSKTDIPFPQAFHLYNKFMGGVDVHDGHCNSVLPSIRSKKWTWVVFIRFIQASITNAHVIFNATRDGKKKSGIKELTTSIAKYYIQKGQTSKTLHTRSNRDKLKNCSNEKCPIRTRIYCEKCNLYVCNNCWAKKH